MLDPGPIGDGHIEAEGTERKAGVGSREVGGLIDSSEGRGREGGKELRAGEVRKEISATAGTRAGEGVSRAQAKRGAVRRGSSEMEYMGDAPSGEASEAQVKFVRVSHAISRGGTNEANVSSAIKEVGRGLEGGAVTHRGAEGACEEGVVGERQGEEGRQMEGGGGPNTTGGGAVPDAIIEGGEGTSRLVCRLGFGGG